MRKDKKLTPGNKLPEVLISEDERHLVHVRLTKRENQPQLKKYIDRVHVQCYSVFDFRQMVESNFFQTYDKTEVVHDPTQEEKKPAATGPSAQKPLSAMNKEELSAAYKAKFGKDAPAELTKALILAALEAPAEPAEHLNKELNELRAAYKAKFDEDADPAATIEDIKELLK